MVSQCECSPQVNANIRLVFQQNSYLKLKSRYIYEAIVHTLSEVLEAHVTDLSDLLIHAYM